MSKAKRVSLALVRINFFEKWANPGLFLFFSNTDFIEIIVSSSGIQTRIVGIEGKHANHLTTAMALVKVSFTFAP